MSLIFSIGGDAPSLFGRNIYIVKADTMPDLKPGTALLTSAVSMSEINEGDIVIFMNADKRAGVAEITATKSSDDVYTFAAVSERGAEITLTQSQIVGKAFQYSDFIGALVNFAKSPAGVLIIAVVPCMIVLIYEASRSIFNGLRRSGELTPVRKQDEIPTYIPRQKVAAVMSAYNKVENPDEHAEGIKDDEDGFLSTEQLPLFLQPPAERRPKPAPPPKRIVPIVPLSQKRLNEAIAEVNSTRSIPPAAQTQASGFTFDEMITDKEPEAVKKTEQPKATDKTQKQQTQNAETIRRYTPKKKEPQKPAAASAQTSSIPSLDRLLKDDDGDTPYNIENILFSIDKKK